VANKRDGKKIELTREFDEGRGGEMPLGVKKMLELNPEFFKRYIDFSSPPFKKGPLPPKVKEFIMIALDSSPTHMFQEGVRAHMRRALELGATKEELLEVFELVSLIGIHGSTLGISVLAEEYPKWMNKKNK
jgi:alkylhydroperoxidase/carboxymuconolactone decarboxylase family protein YurZ